MMSATVDEVWHLVCCSAAYTPTSASRRSDISSTTSRGTRDGARRKMLRTTSSALDRFRLFHQAYARLYGETTAWLEPGPPQEPPTEASERADELTEADLERVAGGGSKPGGEGCDECKVIIKT